MSDPKNEDTPELTPEEHEILAESPADSPNLIDDDTSNTKPMTGGSSSD